jgi:uncharacterized protein
MSDHSNAEKLDDLVHEPHLCQSPRISDGHGEVGTQEVDVVHEGAETRERELVVPAEADEQSRLAPHIRHVDRPPRRECGNGRPQPAMEELSTASSAATGSVAAIMTRAVGARRAAREIRRQPGRHFGQPLGRMERSGLTKVEVRESPIEGKGLIALVAIEEGERIFDDEMTESPGAGQVVMTDDELAAYIETVDQYSARSIGGGRNVVSLERSIVDFGNHSCDSDTWSMNCNCGASVCRGTIGGKDWKRPELQRAYAGHWPTHLVEMIASSKP